MGNWSCPSASDAPDAQKCTEWGFGAKIKFEWENGHLSASRSYPHSQSQQPSTAALPATPHNRYRPPQVPRNSNRGHVSRAHIEAARDGDDPRHDLIALIRSAGTVVQRHRNPSCTLDDLASVEARRANRAPSGRRKRRKPQRRRPVATSCWRRWQCWRCSSPPARSR